VHRTGVSLNTGPERGLWGSRSLMCFLSTSFLPEAFLGFG
jgi:hypothetical protein